MSKTTNKFFSEVRARAVRNEGQHGSRWQAVMPIAAKIGCAPQRQGDRHASHNPGSPSGMPEGLSGGGPAPRPIRARFVPGALEQAAHDRRPAKGVGMVHHSGRRSQYPSIRYSEPLAEAGIESAVGSVGDSYDNALAKTINSLFKAEAIHRRRPWQSFEAVEYVTLEWVNWLNNRRHLEPIRNTLSARVEVNSMQL